MKKGLLLVSALLISMGPILAQCITQVDFTPWQSAESPTQGTWQVVNGGAGLDQLSNTANPTMYISPFDLINVEITGTFRSDDSDDDWLGFVFGHQSPVGTGNYYKTWLFDWKRDDQSSDCGCNVFGLNCDNNPQGMTLASVDGTFPATADNCGQPNMLYFQNHRDNPPMFDVVGRNNASWTQSFDHQFRLIYTSTQATIFIDGTQRFDVTGCFEPGRFGFYNLSQSASKYRNFQYQLLVDFNVATPTVCVGEDALFEFTNPNCGGNFNLQLISSMEWDFGDGNTFLNSNPTAANINPTHAYSTPGTYTVTLTITNPTGCTSSETGTITVTPGPEAIFTANTPCFPNPTTFTNNSTGNISTYAWDFGDGTTSSVQNPPNKTYPAGSYQVSLTVAEAGGCSSTAIATVDVLSSLAGTGTVTDASCPGVDNGEIDLNINNGTAPFTVSWDNGANTEDISGLAPGSFTATFTDVDGCAGTLTETVGVNAAPTATSLTADETCAGQLDGAVDLSVSGGNGNFTYAWNSGQNTEDLAGVARGSYDVTFTDSDGCAGTHTATVGLLPSYTADLILSDFNGSNVSCNGAMDGSIDLIVTGTTGPFTYSWSNGEVTEDVQALGAGGITVTISDTNNCQQVLDTTITEPLEIAPTFTKEDVRCIGLSDGSVDLTVTGGTAPYQFAWSDGSQNEDPQGLPTNTYSVVITDANGCQDNSISVTIDEPTVLTASQTGSTNPTCFGELDGTAAVAGSGGTPPYSYDWSSGDMDSAAIALGAGSYDVTVSDANQCTTTLSVSLTEPAPITVSIAQPDTIVFGDTALLTTQTVADSSDTLIYFWDPSSTLSCTDCPDPGAFNVITQEYELTVSDENNCSATATVTVNVLNDKVFYVPNAFSPNNDGFNDFFEIFAQGVDNIDATVFDRWGEKIFEFGDITDRWDGTYRGKLVRPGVYLFKVEVNYIDGESRRLNGSLLVLN